MKGQAFALDHSLYDYKNISFTLKYHKELEVENRAEGGIFWFRLVYAF